MNDQIFFFFYNLAHQSVFFDKLVIFFAVYFIFIVIVSAMLFLVFYHKIFSSENPIKEFINKWKEFVLLFLSTGIALMGAKILKVLFQTFRPFVIFPQVQPLFMESGYAFPSGHTMLASAIAFAIYFTNKKAGYYFMFFALLIGVSRIVSGVHFPVDILGGFILGAGVSSLVAYFVKNV